MKKNILIFIILMFLIIIFPVFLFAQSEEELIINKSSWYFNIMPRIFGLDGVFTFNNSFMIWIGAGYESFGYFRNSDLSLISAEQAKEQNSNIFDADIKIGYLNGFENIGFYILYKLRYVQYFYENDSLFSSALIYDKDKVLIHSVFLQLNWINFILNNSFLKQGTIITNSYEYSLCNYIDNSDKYYPYYRVTGIFTNYQIILDKGNTAIQFNNRFIIDYLNGDNVPVDALARIGGLQTISGLGSTVRGLPSYYADGYFKIILNSDFVFYLKDLLKTLSFSVYSGLVFFFDIGLTSNYEKTIDFKKLDIDSIYKTTGVGLIVPLIFMDMRLYIAYFINQNYYSFIFEFGSHF